MAVAQVYIQVKSEYVNEFITASKDNAQSSLQEDGIKHFEIIQSIKNPCFFVFIEHYRSLEAQSEHKETAHFKRWYKNVEKMMASPREAKIYRILFP